MADDTTGAGQPAAAPDAAPKAKTSAPDPRVETFAAIIRNGLNDSALSRDAAAWAALETRLPQIVAAIIKEA